MRSCRRLSCTSIWLQELSTWFRRFTRLLYMPASTATITTTTTIKTMMAINRRSFRWLPCG